MVFLLVRGKFNIRRLEIVDARPVPNESSSSGHSLTVPLDSYLLPILLELHLCYLIHAYFLRVLFPVESVVSRLHPLQALEYLQVLPVYLVQLMLPLIEIERTLERGRPRLLYSTTSTA